MSELLNEAKRRAAEQMGEKRKKEHVAAEDERLEPLRTAKDIAEQERKDNEFLKKHFSRLMSLLQPLLKDLKKSGFNAVAYTRVHEYSGEADYGHGEPPSHYHHKYYYLTIDISQKNSDWSQEYNIDSKPFDQWDEHNRFRFNGKDFRKPRNVVKEIREKIISDLAEREFKKLEE